MVIIHQRHDRPAQCFFAYVPVREWSVLPSPNPGAQFNELFGVTAVSPSDVWAVGEFSTPTMIDTLIEFNPKLRGQADIFSKLCNPSR